MDVVAKIRKDLEKSKAVPEGTVIRFASHSASMDREYTYAAVFVAGTWWLSGVSTYFGDRKFSHADFMRILAEHPSIHNVEVATDWDGLIP